MCNLFHFTRVAIIGALCLTAVGCSTFAGAIERAHGKDAWNRHEALSTDFVLVLGQKEEMRGTMLFETAGGRSRIDLPDGTVMVFDGKAAWVSPASAQVPMARFHLLTWPYFVAAPMKLSDPGTHLEDQGRLPLQGETYPAAKLTFAPGTGDTPDDWYVVYADPATHHLKALAYIVTYGKSTEQANEEPHVAVYDSYLTVNGVSLATQLRFWLWSREQGSHGDVLGEITFTNAGFVTPDADAFTKPEDSREDKLPD